MEFIILRLFWCTWIFISAISPSINTASVALADVNESENENIRHNELQSQSQSASNESSFNHAPQDYRALIASQLDEVIPTNASTVVAVEFESKGNALQKILSEVDFDCKGRYEGYYSDVNFGCHIFHYCKKNGLRFTFVCPSKAIFNQQEMTCDSTVVNQKAACESAPKFYYLNSILYKQRKDVTANNASTGKPKEIGPEVNGNHNASSLDGKKSSQDDNMMMSREREKEKKYNSLDNNGNENESDMNSDRQSNKNNNHYDDNHDNLPSGDADGNRILDDGELVPDLQTKIELINGSNKWVNHEVRPFWGYNFMTHKTSPSVNYNGNKSTSASLATTSKSTTTTDYPSLIVSVGKPLSSASPLLHTQLPLPTIFLNGFSKYKDQTNLKLIQSTDKDKSSSFSHSISSSPISPHSTSHSISLLSQSNSNSGDKGASSTGTSKPSKQLEPANSQSIDIDWDDVEVGDKLHHTHNSNLAFKPHHLDPLDYTSKVSPLMTQTIALPSLQSIPMPMSGIQSFKQDLSQPMLILRPASIPGTMPITTLYKQTEYIFGKPKLVQTGFYINPTIGAAFVHPQPPVQPPIYRSVINNAASENYYTHSNSNPSANTHAHFSAALTKFPYYDFRYPSAFRLSSPKRSRIDLPDSLFRLRSTFQAKRPISSTLQSLNTLHSKYQRINPIIQSFIKSKLFGLTQSPAFNPVPSAVQTPSYQTSSYQTPIQPVQRQNNNNNNRQHFYYNINSNSDSNSNSNIDYQPSMTRSHFRYELPSASPSFSHNSYLHYTRFPATINNLTIVSTTSSPTRRATLKPRIINRFTHYNHLIPSHIDTPVSTSIPITSITSSSLPTPTPVFYSFRLEDSMNIENVMQPSMFAEDKDGKMKEKWLRAYNRIRKNYAEKELNGNIEIVRDWNEEMEEKRKLGELNENESNSQSENVGLSVDHGNNLEYYISENDKHSQSQHAIVTQASLPTTHPTISTTSTIATTIATTENDSTESFTSSPNYLSLSLTSPTSTTTIRPNFSTSSTTVNSISLPFSETPQTTSERIYALAHGIEK